MRERTDHVWHCYLPGMRPGRLRLSRPRPLRPGRGHGSTRKAADRSVRQGDHRNIKWSDALFAYKSAASTRTSGPTDDSAGGVPKCVVVDPAFTWEDDRPLRAPWNRTIIYECHVGG